MSRRTRPVVCALCVLVVLALLAPLQAKPPPAVGDTPQEQRWRVAHVPLGMPAEGEWHGQFLEGIYQEQLAPLLVSSIGRADAPVYTIHTRLKLSPGVANPSGDFRPLDIWFSSRETGRRAFWISSYEAQPAGAVASVVMAQLADRFGEPARVARMTVAGGSQVVLVFVLPDMEPAQRRAITQALPEPLLASGLDARDVIRRDFRHKAAWLGKRFRGALVSYTVDASDHVGGIDVELIDMPLASSVLNL